MKNYNLNIGIAGFGEVGKKRKKVLDKIKGVTILAISDKNKKNKPFNKNIKFFNDYKKLFNIVKVEKLQYW